MEPIITSVLDTDLYKISMLQAVHHQYPDAQVTYNFFCRNQGVKLGYLIPEIEREIADMATLSLTEQEAQYLKNNMDFLSDDFVDWLANINPFSNGNSAIDLQSDKAGYLYITIRGKWENVILWEVPLLSIINELYFRDKVSNWHFEGARAKLSDKLESLKPYPRISIAEFGTRRRATKYWHLNRLRQFIAECPNFVGTSNLKLAQTTGLKAIGTVAHEWTMAHLGLVDRIETAQKRALHVWQQEFGQRLGIALTDTFTSDAFFNDFDFTLARAYDGIRQDSGCPYEFTKKALNHYQEVGIDPRKKSIIYSDGLTIPKAIDIWLNFAGQVGISFGIGTNITNDLPNIKPLNIVIKLTSCNGVNTVKLSDQKEKAMGHPNMIERVKQAYK